MLNLNLVKKYFLITGDQNVVFFLFQISSRITDLILFNILYLDVIPGNLTEITI